MSGEVRRFLLDQGFPKPRLPIEELDGRAKFVHLSDWKPELAEVSTPDWLVALHAGGSGRFEAIVTRDQASLGDSKGLVVLMDTGLALITWKEAIEDPISEWGQLVAFLSEIHRVLDSDSRSVIFLPRPQLRRKQQVKLPRAMLGELARRSGVSFPELRAAARSEMNSYLRALDLNQLLLRENAH